MKNCTYRAALSGDAILLPSIGCDYQKCVQLLGGWCTSATLRSGDKMPAKNPRVNVVLEKPLYDSVRRLVAKEEISLSLKIRDLIKDALEAQEDIVLAEVAEEREKTFRRTGGRGHNRDWGEYVTRSGS